MLAFDQPITSHRGPVGDTQLQQHRRRGVPRVVQAGIANAGIGE
jgi:hypothetical protein